LAFGLECCVDFFSSVIVLWRFWAPTLTEETERKLAQREQRADVLISFMLVVLGITVLAAAGEDLKIGPEQVGNVRPMIALSFFSMIMFAVLSFLKIRFSIRLASASLYKDGICSLIGTVLSITLFVSSLIIQSSPGAWWIDPVVSLAVGIFALLYGARCLYVARTREGLPIFSCRWWFTSHGTGDSAIQSSASSSGRPGPETFRPGASSSLQLKPSLANTAVGDDDEGDVV
jgi:hypothetical protein